MKWNPVPVRCLWCAWQCWWPSLALFPSWRCIWSAVIQSSHHSLRWERRNLRSSLHKRSSSSSSDGGEAEQRAADWWCQDRTMIRYLVEALRNANVILKLISLFRIKVINQPWQARTSRRAWRNKKLSTYGRGQRLTIKTSASFRSKSSSVQGLRRKDDRAKDAILLSLPFSLFHQRRIRNQNFEIIYMKKILLNYGFVFAKRIFSKWRVTRTTTSWVMNCTGSILLILQ